MPSTQLIGPKSVILYLAWISPLNRLMSSCELPTGLHRRWTPQVSVNLITKHALMQWVSDLPNKLAHEFGILA